MTLKQKSGETAVEAKRRRLVGFAKTGTLPGKLPYFLFFFLLCSSSRLCYCLFFLHLFQNLYSFSKTQRNCFIAVICYCAHYPQRFFWSLHALIQNKCCICFVIVSLDENGSMYRIFLLFTKVYRFLLNAIFLFSKIPSNLGFFQGQSSVIIIISLYYHLFLWSADPTDRLRIKVTPKCTHLAHMMRMILF